MINPDEVLDGLRHLPTSHLEGAVGALAWRLGLLTDDEVRDYMQRCQGVDEQTRLQETLKVFRVALQYFVDALDSSQSPPRPAKWYPQDLPGSGGGEE